MTEQILTSAEPAPWSSTRLPSAEPARGFARDVVDLALQQCGACSMPRFYLLAGLCTSCRRSAGLS